VLDKDGVWSPAPRVQGSGYLAALLGCPGCHEVQVFKSPCGLGEEHCVVAWAFEHLKEIHAELPRTREAKKEAPSHEGTTNLGEKHE
jgi:hypothetical protein